MYSSPTARYTVHGTVVFADLKTLITLGPYCPSLVTSTRFTLPVRYLCMCGTRLYKLLRTEGPTSRLEKAVAVGVERARGKPQSFHGIPLRIISPSSWSSVSKLLHTVGSFTLPCDKVILIALCVCRCARLPPSAHGFSRYFCCCNRR